MRHFRYFLVVGGVSQQTVTKNPFWGDSMNISKDRAKGEMYYVTTIEGSFRFLRADAERIINAPFNTEFRIIIEVAVNGTFEHKWEGKFFKTDAVEIDEDQTVVTVEAQTVDLLQVVIDNKDKNYNLIDLGPETPASRVYYRKQPLLQVYFAGSDYVTNIISGTYWETPVNSGLLSPFGDEAQNQLINDFHFAYNGDVIVIPGQGAGLNPDVSGLYFTNQLGQIESFGAPSLWRIEHNSSEGRLEIVESAFPNTVVYTAESGPIHGEKNHSDAGVLFTSVTDPTSTCRVYRASVYMRYLVDFEQVITQQGLVNTNPIPVDDIVPPTNYERAIGIEYDGVIASDENQTDSTKYGRIISSAANFGGNYFNEPAFSAGNEWRVVFPLVRSEWTAVSWWFVFDLSIQNVQINASQVLEIREVFPLDAVIRAFLKEWNSSLTFEADELHSKFFYDSSGNDPLNDDPLPLVVFTAKSNIVLGQYDKPANRVNVKFTDITDFLKYAYQCFWFVEGTRFRIENIAWFENGGRYPSEGAALIRFDLNALNEPKTGLPWSKATRKYKYDKTLMPERLEFGWMDQVSDTFQGFPIVSLSDYVDQELKEERRVSNVTTDIDFISANPTIVSRDGLVAMALYWEAALNGYAVFFAPISDLTTINVRWYIQNGVLAYLYLHEKYYLHNAAADRIEVNEVALDAVTVRKNKEQPIQIYGEEEDNQYGLARTGIGDGELISLKESLRSGTYDVIVKHNTE